MTVGSRLRGLASMLAVRLLVILSLAILLLFAIYIVLTQRAQSAAIENVVKTNAYTASDFIRRSLYTAMLRNERDRIHESITLLGNEPGVEVIRIYNKQGVITFSTTAGEMGRVVDRQAEACVACHAAAQPLSAVPTGERARIYRVPERGRVLGLINPIRNEASCSRAACHAHGAGTSVLGVLDVQMSLGALDADAAAAQRRSIALAAGFVLLAVLLIAGIVYRSVHRPALALRRGTERLAGGDLDVTIDLDRHDELGLLARSFNRMAASLREADAELREWSRTLEVRVEEKTGELEQLNRQLVQVEKSVSLGRMAATVAHELNNPLSGILTNAKLTSRRLGTMMADGPDKAKVQHTLGLIQSEAVRCGNIVRDLLTYARQGSAKFRPAKLNELAERALQLVAHHTELRGIQARRELALADDALVCDGEQVVQALVALSVNAVEAMGEGGVLTVRTAAAGTDRVVLAVSDTGVGIPPEIQPRIFDPFFSTKGEAKGVGLGLAVVHGIVQRHEGRIEVASRPGHGTTFTITLPRRPQGQQDAGAAVTADARGANDG